MTPAPRPEPACTRHSARDLVAVARSRVGRQAQYAALIAKGGRKAATAHDWLDRAAECVAALARPQAVRIPLAAQVSGEGILIAGKVFVDDLGLVAGLASGGRLTASLSTLAYGQAEAFEWLGRDYALFHVQTDLARETLFALARAADREERESMPGWRMQRIPVQANELCGQRHSWDAARVQSLLSAFDGVNPGVCLTETGFFQPLHSLLGMMLMRAPV